MFELPQILYYRGFLVWDQLELEFGYQDRKSRPALAIWASHLPSFTMGGQMIKAGSKLLVFGNSACEIYELTITWDKNGFCGSISTEGALRLPTTYDNHPIQPIHPIHI